MTIEQYKQSHNFSVNENRYQGGKIIDTEDIEKIDSVMWATNDYYISLCKWTFPERKVYAQITHVTSGKHTKNSAHPKGKAIDEIIVGVSLFEAIALGSSIRLNHGPSGMGFYPYGGLPFIHFDFKDWDRDLKRTVIWFRDVDGNYISTTRDPERVYEELVTCQDVIMGKRAA